MCIYAYCRYIIKVTKVWVLQLKGWRISLSIIINNHTCSSHDAPAPLTKGVTPLLHLGLASSSTIHGFPKSPKSPHFSLSLLLIFPNRNKLKISLSRPQNCVTVLLILTSTQSHFGLQGSILWPQSQRCHLVQRPSFSSFSSSLTHTLFPSPGDHHWWGWLWSESISR